MTVSTTARKTNKLVMGGETFPFSFRIGNADEIKCMVDGVDLTYSTDYTVVINSNGVGGTVTIVDYSNYTSGNRLIIYRVTDKTQENDFDDYDTNPAITKENALDKLTMITQELSETADRSVTQNMNDTAVDLELPTPVAGKILGWDSDADAIINYDNDLSAIPLGTIGQYLRMGASTWGPVTEDVINVKNPKYGAVGNGSTNDTNAIKAAIVDAQAARKTLYFPSGTYLISSTLTYSGTYSIKGENCTTAVLYTKTNIPMITIDADTSTFFSSITDLEFRAEVTGTRTSNAAILIEGSNSSSHSYCKFHNLAFRGPYYGIRVNKSTDESNEARFNWNSFTNISAGPYTDNCEYGIYFDYGSGTGNVFANMNLVCTTYGLAWMGGNTTNIGDITVSNIQFGGSGTGLYVDATLSTYADRFQITGCQFDAGLTTGINFDGTRAFNQCRILGTSNGGAATHNFTTAPTSSLIEDQTGLYIYDSNGTKQYLGRFTTAINSGTGTITSGSTSVLLQHGLGITPSAEDFTIVPTESPTNDQGNMWISGIDGTYFTVNCRNDPGASNLDFSWKVNAL